MQNMINGINEENGMQPRVIKTNEEYEAAISQISTLMDIDPEPGTPEAIALETLGILIEDYERKHFPIEAPDPITAIEFCMEQQGLTRRDLEPYIGSRGRVSEILSGARPLSLRMIRELNEHLGIPAEILIQTGTLANDDPEIEWEKFPIKEMFARGWINEKKKATVQNFFQLLPSYKPLFEPLYRQTSCVTRWGQEMDEYSLAAWTARITIIALEKDLSVKYNASTIDLEFMRGLAQLSSQDNAPIHAIEYLNNAGIHLIIEPHLPHTYLDGVAVMHIADTPIIGLTLRYDRIDNFWFTLMHELAHLSLHIDGGGQEFFDAIFNSEGNPEDVSSSQKRSKADLREEEADSMAREALIPQDIWESSAASKIPLESEAVSLAWELRIHPAIVAGRIRYELKMYSHLNNLVKGSVREFFPELQWR